jgi:radical SAM protein with 4Fe4S-binding SPASM domain
MPNVLLTEKCSRACPYCFAKKHMGEAGPDDMLAWDEFIYIADFLEASHEKRFSLLGGEPTLHPHFADYVAYLFERGFAVTVFTNGALSDRAYNEAVKRLSNMPVERLSFVCNVNHPSLCSEVETSRLSRFLDSFRRHVSLGYNIYQEWFDLDFVFDLISRYGLKRHLRLGLAHPIPGEDNLFIPIARLHKMVERLLSYIPQFEARKIVPGFDCGFSMCLFTNEQLGRLFKLFEGKVSFGCGPAIDIGPDLSVWSCFPLSKYHKQSLYDFNSMVEVMRFFEGVHKKVRTEIGGIFEKCDSCHYRETGLCHGGCLAHPLSMLHSEEPLRPQEIYA